MRHGREVLEELLGAWERAVVDRVEQRIDAEGGDARAKLRRLFVIASSSHDLLRIEGAIRDWARRDETVAGLLERIDQRRIDYVRSLFAQFCADEDEVEARCVLAMCLFVGAPLIAGEFKERAQVDALTLAAERLLA